MSVFKDLKSIAESANSELISQIDSENDGLAKAIADEFNQIETLEKDVFEYNAPMVPVIQKDLNEGAKYIVEFDMLNKYATDGGIDIVTAYNNVCESNNIGSDDMYVYLRGSITECCTRPEAFEPETLRNSLKAIRNLSENGISLLREEALNESKKDSKGPTVNKKVSKIEAVYNHKLPDEVAKIISSPSSISFSNDQYRILSYDEILNASNELKIDFNKYNIIPIIDCSDNDFIVYNFKTNSWSKFNISDETLFKQNKSLNELIK